MAMLNPDKTKKMETPYIPSLPKGVDESSGVNIQKLR